METTGDEASASLSERKANLCTLKETVSAISVSQIGLFVIVLAYALHRSKPVLLPLVLAILVSLVLRPIYTTIRGSLRLPRMLASVTTVAGLLGLLAFGFYQIAQPGAKWLDTIDREVVTQRLQEVFRPVKEVQAEIKDVADRVEKATQAEPEPDEMSEKPDDAKSNEEDEKPSQDAPEEPEADDLSEASAGPWDELELVAVGVASAENPASGESGDEGEEVAGKKPEKEPVVVEIREDPLDSMVAQVQEFGIGTAAFLILVLFMLAYGNRIIACLSENEATASILDRVGVDVSRYLFTITLINTCLGVAIGLAMWALGMPNPALWGMLGMLLNFIPYVGALIGTAIVFVVAAATFDSASSVLAVPLAYFILTAIEGNFVTPMVLGGRFRLNPLVVFVWIFAWAAFWGIAGMLIAMPALVTFKIICENTATMERFRRVLSA